MTATIFLVRHAAHAHVGHTLSGRQPGLPLSAEGQAQARGLARRFGAIDLAAVQTSPVERAMQTAAAIAGERPIQVVDALTEIDFGEWTGRSFASLQDDEDWRNWNGHRARATAKGGESMADAQARAVSHLQTAAATFSGANVLMVSHCDIIRAVICHVLGLTLDNLLRFEIDPASNSVVQAGDWGMRVVRVNEGSAV